ncbi:DNA damage-inducible transcript 4 protein-like [Synchiropus picturatus]
MSFTRSQSLDGSFPPSPAEDRGSVRLSWGSLVHRLTELKRISQSSNSDLDCSATEPGSDSPCLETDCTFLFHALEESLATELLSTITQSLIDASPSLGCSRIILPDCLLLSIHQELVHLAVSEPCGLRGAVVDLCVDKGDQSSLCSVGQITVDPTLVPTFNVTLVLRVESSGLWPKVQRFFRGGKSVQSSKRNQMILSSSFRAMKRKLYSSAELLIEDCC